MALADFGAGAQVGLQRLIAAKLQAQLLARQEAQQQFENQRQMKGDDRAQQQLDALLEQNEFNRTRQGELDKSLISDRQTDNARQGREMWTPGQIVGAQEPVVEQWQQAGVPVGAAVPGVAPRLYTSPTDTKGTPGAAPDKPVGFLLSSTSAQADKQAAQRDKQTDNARLDSTAAETARHNAAMERNAYLAATKQPASTTATPAQTAQQQNEVTDALSLIDQIANDPALDTAVGPIDAYIGKARDLAGVNRFERLNNELIGKLSLAQAGKLRGQGQISDKERALLRDAATALGRNLSEADYKAELAKIRAQFARMQSPITPAASHNKDGAQTKPTAADLIKKYGGG